MKISKNIIVNVLLLATLLCCFWQLVDAYAEMQPDKSIVCTNPDHAENSFGQHDDSFDDDQLEPNASLEPITVSFAGTIAMQQYIFQCFFTSINWQPPKA